LEARDWVREPDLALAGLAVWIKGYQYPDVDDYGDGNWLYALARVVAPGASVEAFGAFIEVGDFIRFLRELETVDRDLRGDAGLSGHEPNLRVEISGRSHGQFDMRIEITPDHMTQSHEFRFDIDQTFFKPAIAQCRRLIERFPLRGTPPGESS
jgi:hypothetical protein